MIEPEQLYNVNFYQKEKFYGSYKGLHYRIEKYDRPAGTESTNNAEEMQKRDTPSESGSVFRVITWPGPYNFESTADEKKETEIFDFSNEALREICSFLNKKWEKEYRK